MTVNRIILSIMCFAFLLAYHVSISDVSQFVQKKPEYVDKWFVEVSQKIGYSCLRKPCVRAGGNRQSGQRKPQINYSRKLLSSA